MDEDGSEHGAPSKKMRRAGSQYEDRPALQLSPRNDPSALAADHLGDGCGSTLASGERFSIPHHHSNKDAIKRINASTVAHVSVFL